MKKIFAFLLLGLTVAFASCGDEKTCLLYTSDAADE